MAKLLLKILPESLLRGYLSKAVRAALSLVIAKLLASGASKIPGLEAFLANPELHAYLETLLVALVYPAITYLKRKLEAKV